MCFLYKMLQIREFGASDVPAAVQGTGLTSEQQKTR